MANGAAGTVVTAVVARVAAMLVAMLAMTATACRDRGAEPGGGGKKTSFSLPGADAARSGRGALRIVKLQVRDRTSPNDQVVRLRRKQLRRLVARHVSAQPGFTLDIGDESGPEYGVAHTLRLDVELQSIVGSEKGKASVLVAAQMRRKGAPLDEPAALSNALQEKVYVIEKLRSLRALYEELLGRAVSEALRALGLEGRLRAAPAELVSHAIRSSRLDELDQGWTSRMDAWQPLLVPGQLTLQGDVALPALAALLLMSAAAPTSSSPESLDVRELAIKTAAVRRLRAAVPAIVAVLKRDSRERMRDLCLGALAEIGDPAAVPALIRYTRGGDEDRLRKVIGVLGQIGGQEARAFLEMTADSHALKEVQELARETLQALRAQTRE